MIEYTVKVYDNGDKAWYLNGEFHREDGPAVERPNGYKAWYLNGVLHREDGPAIKYTNGDKEWFINGKLYTEEDYLKKLQSVKELTVSDISDILGYTVKIVK